MSMDRCKKCERLVDTDADCSCYDFDEVCLCEWCRDEKLEAMTEAEYAAHEKKIYG